MATGTRSQSKKNGNSTPLVSVYFEKQEGRLCAQHCINNALQDNVVDAIMLSEYGQGIDAAERQVAYGENALNTGESNNFDDSGYFSVQVIQTSLVPYDLTLIPINEEGVLAASARKDPVNARLYIFHENDHWYCARRFADKQWILLNSLKEPVEITDSELATLVITKVTGRQIFLVAGFLKDCPADEVYSRVMKDSEGVTRIFTDPGKSLGTRSEEEELQEALSLSLGKTPQELLREKRAKFLANLEKKETASTATAAAAGDGASQDGSNASTSDSVGGS